MMNEPELSRRMLAQSGSASVTDEAARAYLQARLEVYARVMFWAFVALRVLEVILYRTYPTVRPHQYTAILVTGIVGLLAMAVCWRGVLVGRARSLTTLGWIDLVYTASCGVVFGVTAVLAYDRHESAFTCLIYACFVVFMRTLVLPSRGRMTAMVSTCAMTPIVLAAGILAAYTKQEIPGAVFAVSATAFSALAVVIATVGSRFIYGLRRRVDENTRLGQFTLDRKIGEGARGVVYRARHALLRRPTAIKLLHPKRFSADLLAHFEREVQHMSQLTHPNTVAVFDYGHSPDGVYYYAMEYLDGIDLGRLVRDHGAQPPGRVIEILAQVCGALHEAHSRGLAHRDVKPSNIILCERGGAPDVAKLGDFGLAHDADQLGPASDLRALGSVGLYLLAGRSGALGPSAAALGAPALEALLSACTDDDVAARPASAAALAEQLRALPRDGWDSAAARVWWSELRRANADGSTSTPSMTLTVDLGSRT